MCSVYMIHGWSGANWFHKSGGRGRVWPAPKTQPETKSGVTACGPRAAVKIYYTTLRRRAAEREEERETACGPRALWA